MDDDSIVFVERNASPKVIGPIVPARTVATVPTTTAYVRAPHPAATQQVYPQYMQSPQFWGSAPIYQQPAGYPSMPPFWGGLLGNLTAGDVIDVAGELVAAFSKRPDSPAPTGDVAVDVQNLVAFVGAFADHIDNKDKIRAGGHGIGRFLGGR